MPSCAQCGSEVPATWTVTTTTGTVICLGCDVQGKARNRGGEPDGLLIACLTLAFLCTLSLGFGQCAPEGRKASSAVEFVRSDDPYQTHRLVDKRTGTVIANGHMELVKHAGRRADPGLVHDTRVLSGYLLYAVAAVFGVGALRSVVNRRAGTDNVARKRSTLLKWSAACAAASLASGVGGLAVGLLAGFLYSLR